MITMTAALFDRAIDSCDFPEALRPLARRAFATWELVPYLVDGAIAGVAFLQGAEIHVAVFPEFRHRALQKHRIRAFLAPLVRRMGFLVTRVNQHDAGKRRFVERVGFEHVTDNGHSSFYYLSLSAERGSIVGGKS